MRTKILSLLLCVIAAINANAQTLPDVAIAEGPFGANWASLSNWECPDWFRDAKFGIWAHWGPQCQAEDGDWYARHMYFPGQSQYNYHVSNFGDPSVYGLKELIRDWTAPNWNPDALVKLYKEAGAQYFFTLGQHHDNFDLWDSPYQEWNSVNLGPQRDIVGEWAQACDKYGLPLGVSMHGSHTWTWLEGAQAYDGNLTKNDGNGQWWEGYDPQELYAQNHAHSSGWQNVGTIHSQWAWGNGASLPDEAYKKKFQNRVLQCINAYHPKMIYFDDTVLPFYGCDDQIGLNILQHYYNDAVINDGSADVVPMGKILEDSHKQAMLWDVERGIPDRCQELPWQTCTCIGQWHYDRNVYNQNKYKSAATVIRMLVDVVSKNGNLLLSIPVRADGTIDEKEQAVVADIKAWMDINKESIYATRPWKTFGEGPLAEAVNPLNAQGFNEGFNYTSADVRYNQKDGKVYATIMKWPTDPNFTFKAFAITAASYSGQVEAVKLLGYGEVNFQHDNNGLTVEVPTTHANPIAPVYEISFDQTITSYQTLQQLITAVEANMANNAPTTGINTGKYSLEAYNTLLQAVNDAKTISETDEETVIQNTLTALRGAWETYQTEGFTDGGELTDNSGTDITEEKLIETENFSRTDASSSRFGTPMYWTVENFSVPQKNTANGTKNGIDNYTGTNSLMLGVWGSEDAATSSDLANARIYRKITLPAGQYFFGATYNQLNAVYDKAYIFAAEQLTTTDNLPIASTAYYAVNKGVANDDKYYGIEFTLNQTKSIYIGWQADLANGNVNQEFRADKVILIKREAQQQEQDVTDTYLVNPDFEGSYEKHSVQPVADRAIYKPEGWTVDWNSNSDDLSALTTADLYSNLITGSFTMIDPSTRGDKTYWARLSYKRITTPKFRILQTVSLPAGRYRLSADMLQYNASTNNKAYLFAGSTTTECPTSSTKSDAAGWNNVQVEFTLNEPANIELGFSISHPTSGKEQIVGVDNFKLILLESYEGNVSYTSRLVNPSFEYTAEGVAWTSTWRGDPWGWSRTGNLTGNSYGISNDGIGYDGNALCWYRSVPMPDYFEMSQTVEGLPAGHYVVSCKMMNNTGMVANQRLFANRFSRYFGSRSMYGKNIDESEIYSFQELTPTSGDKQLEDLTLDILLYEGQALSLGIKSSNLMSDGSKSTAGAGWFKADDFRISYKGYDPQEFIDFLRQYVVEGQTLVNKPMDSDVKTALQTALANAMNVDANSQNTEVWAVTEPLLDALVAARASVKEKAENRNIHIVMDMVHHNPGEAQYDSQYNDPATLAAMGYNAKCFYLFDSPTLAINWDDFDPQILPEGSADRQWVENKAVRLNTLYDECEANNIDVYAMCDLVLLPKRLVSLYNIGSTYGNPLDETTQRILRYQMEQSFAQFPQLDGLVVRIGETYLQDAPYHQGNIQNKTSAENCIIPLIQLLREVVCENLNKKIIFRTWMSFDEDLSLYNQVSSAVEPHENLYLGVKHCEGDFHRGDPFSKVLGQGQHQQVVEVQCAREYEGKGAFPNYVARGVIDGFEEDQTRHDNGLNWCLRDVYDSGLLSGVWTWTRGGGWEGPYIKDELWCDLNAWVMAQWALQPEKTEEEIFNDYCTQRLGIDATNAAILRNIALASEHAVIRGLRSAQYPSDIYNMWVRDEYITFPTMPAQAKTAVVLQERDEAVADWENILQWANEFNSDDVHLNEVVKVTCEYGYYMFRIFRDVSYAAAIHQAKATGNVKTYVQDYNEAWFKLEQLAQQHATTCPTLYNRNKVMRTSSTVADKMMKSLAQTKVNFTTDYGLQQRDITVEYLLEARNFARTDELVNGQYKRYGTLKNWTVENLGIDMGTDGINNGADKYNGMCEINMDQWYNGFVGQDSKVYRKITLPAGRYAFNAYATSCFGMDNGTTYMFVSKSLPTTSTIETLDGCNYTNMAINAHTGWWGIEFTLDEQSDIWLGWCADFDTGNYELRISDIQLIRAVDPDNGLPAHDDEAISTDTKDLYIPVSQWADKGTFQTYLTSCQYDADDPTFCRFADWKNRAAVVGDVNFEDGKYDIAYFYIKYDGATLYGNSGASSLTASNTIDLWIDNTTPLEGDAGAIVLNGQHIATLPGTTVGGVMSTYEIFEVQLPEGIQGVHTVYYKNNGYSPLIRGIGFKDTSEEQEPDNINITMNSYEIMTYCSPYDLDFTNREDNLKCYVVTGFSPSENSISFTRVDKVQAGTGIVLMGAQGDYTIPVNTTDKYWANLLVGVLEPTTVNATSGTNTNFILGVMSDGFINWCISEGGTLAANKAYLQLPTASVEKMAVLNGAPMRWIFDDEQGEMTGIKVTDMRHADNDDWFTIDGRKLTGKPQQKGTYIVGGKKVFIK